MNVGTFRHLMFSRLPDASTPTQMPVANPYRLTLWQIRTHRDPTFCVLDTSTNAAAVPKLSGHAQPQDHGPVFGHADAGYLAKEGRQCAGQLPFSWESRRTAACRYRELTLPSPSCHSTSQRFNDRLWMRSLATAGHGQQLGRSNHSPMQMATTALHKIGTHSIS